MLLFRQEQLYELFYRLVEITSGFLLAGDFLSRETVG